eukprot:TRINITY_DN20758_c0_g1_i1.p1 TRINITY_DN20758_c0_g1~~TRINITY_DN20758_c0_g1_i1.p1  ORF type:complete len:339 (+),score=2.30 TRINITY_DN20758_c0_g1_i1:153-1169(+)
MTRSQICHLSSPSIVACQRPAIFFARVAMSRSLIKLLPLSAGRDLSHFRTCSNVQHQVSYQSISGPRNLAYRGTPSCCRFHSARDPNCALSANPSPLVTTLPSSNRRNTYGTTHSVSKSGDYILDPSQEAAPNPSSHRINPTALPALPTLDDIVRSAGERKLKIAVTRIGPWFRVEAVNADDDKVLGTAECFIRPWFDGTILHLDSMRTVKIESGNVRSIFGITLIVGAMAVRIGYENGCKRMELLAINDSTEYHEKLVRYYQRLGFRPVHEVKGGTLEDLSHMLVWGGIGTRMDGDPVDLLGKWTSVLSRGRKTKGKAETSHAQTVDDQAHAANPLP